MLNQDFDKLLNDPNAKQKIGKLLSTKEGRMLAENLSKMASSNPDFLNALNFASKGDMNSAKNSVNSALNTKQGKEMAEKLSKILGNK